MTKYLQVEMLDKTIWEVPALLIAKDRAKYYASKELNHEKHGKIYKEEFEYTMSDDFEIKDWASNNMNWDDVKHAAILVTNPPEPDFDEGWVNGEKEIIEK